MVRACLTALLVTAITPALALADEAPRPAAPPAPVASPVEVDPCGIELRRAPDDARALISAELAADPVACAGQLEVWIVASDGGLYVQARDRLGRIRERVVADAATAATLLASWVEIDAAQPVWTPPAPAAPVIAAAPAVAAPAAAPAAAPVVVAVAAPGQTPALVAVAPPPRRRPTAGRSVGLAVLAHQTGSGMGGGGARLDVDLRRWRGWQLGGAATALLLDGSSVTARDPLDPTLMSTEVERQSFDLLLTARRRYALGRVELAPAVGAGVGAAHHQVLLWQTGSGNSFLDEPYSVGPRVEASLTAGLHLLGRWHLEAGVSTSMAGHREVSGGQVPVWADGGTSVQAGVRYQP